uniref:Uncharacterized protein n=1 Tax=Anabas testudineus TaxID=64144 RepID=A0A3Q1HIK2_ANATE
MDKEEGFQWSEEGLLTVGSGKVDYGSKARHTDTPSTEQDPTLKKSNYNKDKTLKGRKTRQPSPTEESPLNAGIAHFRPSVFEDIQCCSAAFSTSDRHSCVQSKRRNKKRDLKSVVQTPSPFSPLHSCDQVQNMGHLQHLWGEHHLLGTYIQP